MNYSEKSPKNIVNRRNTTNSFLGSAKSLPMYVWRKNKSVASVTSVGICPTLLRTACLIVRSGRMAKESIRRSYSS